LQYQPSQVMSGEPEEKKNNTYGCRMNVGGPKGSFKTILRESKIRLSLEQGEAPEINPGVYPQTVEIGRGQWQRTARKPLLLCFAQAGAAVKLLWPHGGAYRRGDSTVVPRHVSEKARKVLPNHRLMQKQNSEGKKQYMGIRQKNDY